MVQVSYPGVYVQERSSGVRTITGVSTSIAVFFGRTSKGPINKPVRCLSRSDVTRTFGDAHPQSELGASLTQFYANGGTDCYVVRLVSASAVAAKVTLQTAGTTQIDVTAKSAGTWGSGLRLEVDYGGPHPGEAFNLRISQEEGGKEIASERFEGLTMDPSSQRFAPAVVTQGSDLVEIALANLLDTNIAAGFSEARRPLGTNLAEVQASLVSAIAAGRSFEISVDGSPYVKVTLGADVSAANLDALATGIEIPINTALGTLVPGRAVDVTFTGATQKFLRITAATPTGADNSTVRVRRAAADDIAGALLLGAEDGGVEVGRWSDARPLQTGTVLARDTAAPGGLDGLMMLTNLAQGDIASIKIGTETDVSLHMVTVPPATTEFYKDAKPPGSPGGGNDGVREKLQIIAQAISAAPGTRYKAELQGYELVILAKDGPANDMPESVVFSAPLGANQATTDAIDALNAAMIRRNARQYVLGNAGASPFATSGLPASDGGALGFADYVGDQLKRTGLYALDGVDLFNLMLLPADEGTPAATAAQICGPASTYCAARRAFLLIDPPDSWTSTKKLPSIVQNTADINALRSLVVKDHSAVYYPKIRVNDGGTLRTIGPAGTIAGLMARIDATRGVWKAPAGTEADLRSVVGLDVTLTDLENGVLNKLAVNCLRSFVSGSVSWGARTLDGADELASEWKYVPIRRLALLIEESLYRGTQWVVFEANDEPLWANIRLNVGVFMNQLFRQGAFQGSTPDQAYFVKCDGETTTQADRNLGIVNIEVGFAPLKPAEFVVITIQQIAGDLL